MPDVVVTVPRSFGLDRWIAEGDLPSEPWSGMESFFHLGGFPPDIQPGERVYIVYNSLLRGYAPLVRIEYDDYYRGVIYPLKRFSLVRRGGAVAITIDENIPGFRGWRYRWWDRAHERPFPDWMIEKPFDPAAQLALPIG